MARRQRDPQAGTSLVELLVVIVLLAIVGGAVASLAVTGSKSQRFTASEATSMDATQTALVRVSKEVRNARQVLSSSTATTLTFWSDTNIDGVMAPSEQVTYTITSAGGSLSLQRFTAANASPVVLVSGLDATSGFAYDVTPPATRSVTVTFASTPSSSSTPFSLKDTVRLRNVP